MQSTARDLGYTVYSRIEDSLRQWLCDKLIGHFGENWPDQIPSGVWDNAQALAPNVDLAKSPEELLDLTYLSDLSDIICFRGAYKTFFPTTELQQDDFQDLWASIESAERHFAKASELMRTATRLAPRDQGMWLSRGQVESKAGNYDEAIVHLETAQGLAPDDEIIQAALADAERRAGRFGAADKHFTAAIAQMESKGTEARQIAIQKTARADNFRRWAEELKKTDKKKAADVLATASKLAHEAVQLQPNDPAASGTKRQIELDLGHVIFGLQGFAAASSHYESAIARETRDHRDKRVNEVASFVLADHYLRLGRQEDAKRFLEICAANSSAGSKYRDKLPELQTELRLGRTHGKVEFVNYNKDFGFITTKTGSRTIKFVRSDLCNAISSSDFNRLGGRSVSFVRIQTPQGEVAAHRVVVLE